MWPLMKAQMVTLILITMQTKSEPVSFDRLPQAVAQLIDDMSEVKQLLNVIVQRDESSTVKWMSVEDLMNYLPGRPAKQTIYSWVWKKCIPYHKAGAKLQFLRSEIDAWILGEASSLIEDSVTVTIPVKARNPSNKRKGARR